MQPHPIELSEQHAKRPLVYADELYRDDINKGAIVTWQERTGEWYCHWRHAPGCCALAAGKTKAEAIKNAEAKALILWRQRNQ